MSSIKISDLYAKAQDDLKFNGDKAWETMKFSFTLSSALTTVIVSLLGVISYLSISVIAKAFFMLIPILVAIIMKEFVDVTEKNFERECRRMYENMTILMKIEDELPQRKDKSDNRNFRDETKYIPLEWEKCKFSTTKQYVDEMMRQNDRFYSNMRPIFSILRKVSYALIAIVFGIIFITVEPILCSFS
jgi:hypothetical protein